MKILSLLFVLLSFNSFADDEILGGMDGANNPNRFSSKYSRIFSKLPLSGDASNGELGWSGYYWPTREGGVANRWQTDNENLRNREYYSRSQLMSLNPNTIALLSPAEKYDIMMGNYSYPISRRRLTGRMLRSPIHNGICNGWSMSTMHHKEPTPITVKNKDGIVIPFGASDVKAILAYNYAKYAREADGKIFVGSRCVGRLISKCDGLNPGSFHVILANRIGIEKKPFAGDVSKGKEVWNHPFFTYKSTVLDSYERDGITVKIIETKATHADGLKKPLWETALGTDKQIDTTVDYKYSLYINSFGEIIGGRWISYKRPDFVWYLKGLKEFSGDFSGLNTLLK